MRVLIAEDDQPVAKFLQRGLEMDGHRVRVAHDGEEALAAWMSEQPDLLILDLNLPKRDGESVLVETRKVSDDALILVLTGRDQLETRVRCLEQGADDLMLKPFSFLELRARCRALLRRRSGSSLTIRVGDLEVSRLDRTVMRGEKHVNLTNREFALLEQLLLNRGRCLSRLELLETVWRLEPAQTTNIVDVYVNYLRRKLRDERAELVRTVRGKGYMIPLATESSAYRSEQWIDLPPNREEARTIA